MKNKTLKIMAIVILTIISTLLITSNVLATEEGGVGLNATITAENSEAATNITKVAGQVLNIVQIVGVAVATIMLTVLGIKYVSASPNEKAEYKKGMTIYVIGAILLFGASIVIGIIKNFIKAF